MNILKKMRKIDKIVVCIATIFAIITLFTGFYFDNSNGLFFFPICFTIYGIILYGCVLKYVLIDESAQK
jgi:hypothetical protein